MKLKIKVKDMSSPYMGMEEGEKRDVEHVCIERLKDGYLICPMGGGAEGKEYIKSLKEAPGLLAKLFGIENKNAKEVKDDMEYED